MSEQEVIVGNTPPIGGSGITNAMAAELMNVSVRSVERAGFILKRGIPELNESIMAGRLKLGAAEKIARLPLDRQLAELQKVLGEPHPKREPPSIEKDATDIADLINSRVHRWSQEDRRIMAMTLRSYAEQILGTPLEAEDRNDDESAPAT